jgi:predicted amidohydrolase YtcJ
VVLDRDFFTVPEDEIRRIRSLLTVVGGRIAHNDGIV